MFRLKFDPLWQVWAIVTGFTVLFLIICLLPVDIMEEIVEEFGVVENITVVGYFVAATLLLLDGWREHNKQGIVAAVVVFMLGLRELDFHEKFTTMGMFKSRFYLSPEVPIVEKCIVLLITLILFWGLAVFLKKNIGTFMTSWRQKHPWAVAISMAIVSIILSKTLDSNSGPLVWLIGLVLNEPETYTLVLEEVMELAIPCFILLGAFHFYPSRHHSGCIHTQVRV